MTTLLLRTGYDFSGKVLVEMEGAAENLVGATIKASLKSYSKTNELIIDTSQSNSAIGADWANGIVVIEFSKLLTAPVRTYGPGWIELAVTKGGKTLPCNDVSVLIEKGFTVS